jgi:hypothetical protein
MKLHRLVELVDVMNCGNLTFIAQLVLILPGVAVCVNELKPGAAP